MVRSGQVERRIVAGVLAAVLAASCSGGGDDTAATTTRPSAPATSAATSVASVAIAWSQIRPTLAAELDPASANVCTSGVVPDCIDAVVAEMQARTQPLIDRCDHNAPFALTYQVTTQAIGDAVDRGDGLREPRFLAHFDAWFAAKYFDARDHWLAGEHDQVPDVWRIAFQASDDKAVSTLGDVLLGMNAHISWDLAMTVAETMPQEQSGRRSDYQSVDDILGQVQPGVLEALRAIDATVGVLEIPGPLGTTSFVELITGWRADAYAAGRRIADATSDQEREAAIDLLTTAVVARAEFIRVLTSNLPVIGDVSGRDDRCGG